MKNLKNKIAAIVCGLVLLCGVTYTATAKGSISCYLINCTGNLACVDNGSAGSPSMSQYEYNDAAINRILCGR